jgi:hypothetical protein
MDLWMNRAKASGLIGYQIDALVKMFVYYGKFGFWGNPRILTQLLGRAPNTLEMFVARTLRAHGDQSKDASIRRTNEPQETGTEWA